MPLPWFDAHLDLAMLAVEGRDMLGSLDAAHRPNMRAGLTLSSLVEGNVRLALGTIFTAPDDPGPEGYPVADADRAHAVGRAQLEAYLTWRDLGRIQIDRFAPLRATRNLSDTRAGMGVGSAVPLSVSAKLARLPRTPPIHLGILMENADPIRSPDEVQWWKACGLVAVGLSWASPSRYATGNRAQPVDGGLTAAGRDLVRALDRERIIHDASHLSDASFHDLSEATDRVIIASHSNCRAITDPSGANQRHLTDAQIKEIARRGGGGGVIGVVLYSRFLVPNWQEGTRATIADAVAHIEHICDLTGSRAHAGLGSDMDGGFSASALPEGIDTPAGYQRIAEALSARNWPDHDIHNFATGNWLRIFG